VKYFSAGCESLYAPDIVTHKLLKSRYVEHYTSLLRFKLAYEWIYFMLEKLLVPIDGSEHAEEAMFFALNLADRFDSEMKILNVLPNVDTLFASSPMWVGEHLERMMEENREMLENHFEKARDKNPDLKITMELKEGRPADVIVELAEEEDYSMIVMGSRGLGVVQEMVLGSVSREVVEKSKRPVLIVK